MNEKQRKELNQVNPVDPAEKNEQDNLSRIKEKTSDDFMKYFEATYEPPNMKKAKKRLKKEVQYHDDFEIPEELASIGEGRKFLIRTYGCQMNEHDTEVMSGILTEMGFEATTETKEADIILLNTCAIGKMLKIRFLVKSVTSNH